MLDGYLLLNLVHGTRPMRRHILLLPFAAACALPAVAATAQEPAGQAVASRDNDQRLICRRMPDTGSLVRTRRQCFTRAEWDRIAETARRGAQRTVTELSGGFNGNN